MERTPQAATEPGFGELIAALTRLVDSVRHLAEVQQRGQEKMEPLLADLARRSDEPARRTDAEQGSTFGAGPK